MGLAVESSSRVTVKSEMQWWGPREKERPKAALKQIPSLDKSKQSVSLPNDSDGEHFIGSQHLSGIAV